MQDATTDTADEVTQGLSERLADVRQRIAAACEKAGRRTESVTLVAVTKYATPEQIRALIRLGVADLAENHVQNLQQRATQFNEVHHRMLTSRTPGIAPKLRWHMIGHLQRNKVKLAAPHITMLQTLDSLRLAEEIDQVAPKLLGAGNRMACLMQINCSGEDQKTGVAVGAARHLAEQVADMPNLRLMGVMTMARISDTHDQARHTYARCREIFEEIKQHKIAGEDMRHLSMGMSDDFEAGILEGATIVRIGSAIFGKRDEQPSS